MDDGTGEASDDGHAFSLQDLADILAIELAKALRDLAHHAEGELRRAREHGDHLLAWNDIQGGVHFRHGGGGARLIVDDGEFAKYFPGRDARQHLPFAVT